MAFNFTVMTSGQAVNQSAEVQSAMEFFATAHSFPEGCQAYKNEVYLVPTDLVEASQRTHREHSPSDVEGKVPVRSCRECHQETADHQFVDKQLSRVFELRSALEIFATAHSCRVFFQAYKNEVYLLPTELVEASQRTHREHFTNDVVVKVPVRSCRVYHQKSAVHQFVDWQ